MNYIKKRCQKDIGILKSVSSFQWRGDQHTLLQLYRSLVRSKIDYGAVVYQSASITHKKAIDTIANECLRIASGCFKSTPIDSLNVITGELPMEYRRQLLTLKYYIKVKSQYGNPAYNVVVPSTDRLLFRHKNIKETVATGANDLLDALQIERRNIMPVFSYRLLKIDTPTWKIASVRFDLILCELRKGGTHEAVYRVAFQELVQERYRNHAKIFTDESKSKEGVGTAAVQTDTVRRTSLQLHAAVYTAEVQAISLALNMVEKREHQQWLLCTDSVSAIETLRNKSTRSNLARRMQHTIDTILGTQGKTFTVM